jgi:hypothetical protein
MTDHYIYLDETGTLDFETREGENYFGVGTVHFAGDHRDAIWAGFQLRVNLESQGIRLTRGLHAKDDSHATRREVYAEIAQQEPAVSSTMLCKANAFPSVRQQGKVRLYKMAVWLHLKYVIPKVSRPGDRVLVIVGTLQTSAKRDAIRRAVHDVCQQLDYDREVVPCIWDASSSWGIQVADYCLWAIQRRVEGKRVEPATELIDGLLKKPFLPWGKAGRG